MLDIFIFELRYRFTRPATYMYFGLLLLVSLLLFASGSTPATEKVYHNAPMAIANLMLIISLFGILIASAIMGVPLYRDIEHKTGTFLFSLPITKSAYFMGRFWGSFFTLLFVSLGVVIGIYLGTIIGSLTGWTPAERYGPNLFMNYFHPWITLVVPNLWFFSCLFFALIIFTKNIKAIYSGGIIVFIVYLLTNFLANDLDNKELVQILDPLGLNSFIFQIEYLTPFEQNTYRVDISGNLLINRILWVSVGFAFFIASYLRFSFKYFFNSSSGKIQEDDKEDSPKHAFDKKVSTSFSSGFQWQSLITLSKLEMKNVLKDSYFRAILLGGLIFLAIDFWIGNTIYSVPNLPSTSFLMEYKGFTYNIFVFIILVFFGGETLHRDKGTGYSSISDTFPIKDGILIGSKFFGMTLTCFFLATIPVFVGFIVQTLQGYFYYDMSVYLIDSYLISFPDYLQMLMLVFAVHLIVNNKFAGHAVSIGIWLLMIVLRVFADFNFNLFFFSYKPSYLWSDMNGLGHFGTPLFWFNIYWTAFGLFLILFFSLFYSRGSDVNFKKRFSQAKGRMTSPTAIISYVFLLVTMGVGGYIYKTVVYTNGYVTVDEQEQQQVDYEKQLKQYEYIAQPKIISVKIAAEIFPNERDAYSNATVQLVNKTTEEIDSLHLSFSQASYFHAIYKGDTLQYRFPLTYDKPKFQILGKKKDKPWYKIYALPYTMQPGDTLELAFNSALINTGFVNSGYSREVVYNGTFIGTSMPSIGYSSEAELSSDEKRKEHDLPEKENDLPTYDDPYGTSMMLFNDDADLVTFEATIGTTIDQMAVAPGYLQNEWIEGDRRYFHYVQDSKISLFFSLVSADYAVFNDEAKLPDGSKVDIEIFHLATHKYNLERFSSAFKDGIEYFSEAYGPYQHRQIRLLEFPRYAGFAQSFPNTVPYSESFGWVADFSDPDDFDYGYFVTAHELAHQWWGHQVVPNYTRGSNLISESLAEYTALVLSEQRYGKANMKTFLEDELNKYLRGRAREGKKENVFIDCNRPYQWYNKGSLILYGLRDYIGDSAINHALRSFRDEYAFRENPPFAGSHDLFRHLEEVTPDSLQYYLDDTWKKITLYENKCEEATATKKEDDLFEVTIKVSSQKLYADSLGQESNANYQGDYIDVGVFAAEDRDKNGRKRTNPLYLQKHKLSPGEHTITIVVSGEPVKAGIDPFNKLIDRRKDDNTISVDIE
ncbi:MAG: M1 family aminopeptidase [Reichenbachiella sp.]